MKTPCYDGNLKILRDYITSDKSGDHVNFSHIRDLGPVIDRENAAIGVYVTITPQTNPMKEVASGKGLYHSPGWNKYYPRLQILTVEEILDGTQVDRPPNMQTFNQAGKALSENNDQGTLEV